MASKSSTLGQSHKHRLLVASRPPGLGNAGKRRRIEDDDIDVDVDYAEDDDDDDDDDRGAAGSLHVTAQALDASIDSDEEKPPRRVKRRRIRLIIQDEEDDGEAVEAVAPASQSAPVRKRHAVISDGEAKSNPVKKNAQRRAERHLEAIQHPERAIARRKASGLQNAAVISAFWIQEIESLARGELKKQQAALGQNIDSLQRIQAVVSAFISHNGHEPIPADSHVWTKIPAKTAELLVDIASNPTSWDIQKYLANGTLRLSKRNDPCLNSVAAIYIRRVSTPGQSGIDSRHRYLAMHPADAPNTILQLVLLGATLPSIQQPFEEAMVEYGLSGAVTAVFKRLASNSALQALSATRQANTETISPYAGFTTVLAGKRGWDDLEADSDVRVVNFLHCLEEVHFSTYHLLELDTPIESAVHVRTLPVISHLERIVRAILGSDALNSSPGGVLPIFEPSAEQQQLKSHLLSLYVQDPAPLGTERDLLLEMRLRELLNDEVSLLQREQTLKISPSALDLLKEKLAGVLRLTQGRVVCLEITKDVPLEGLLGTFGGYWDATVGRGPKEDRHLRRIFSPQIPAAGDLSSPVITRFIGPYVDFWRIILHHLLYWIHVLLLSRLLSLIRPLIIITQSNPVAATFRAGDLISAWEFLSDDDQRSFLAGTSPRAILKQLPDRRYRQSRGDAFNESLGVMSIVQTGPSPSQLSILMPTGDAGRIKYDPILAPTRGNVDFFSRLKAGTLTHLVAAELKSGNIPPREDEAAMLSFLRLIKDRAEALFDTAGITEALASAKEAARMMEFAVTFLRSMAAAKRGHEEWVARGPGEGQKAWTGLIASPKGEEREHQLAAINERAWFLDSLDQDADPQRLGHWAAPLPSPEFDEFFRGLGNGKDVVRASNAHGRTKQSAERATSNQQGIGAWRKTHVVEVVVDTDAITRNNMLQAIDAVAEANVYDVREVLQSWRMAVCGDCGELVVARHNASYHFCAVKQSKRLLTEAQFPDIERVLYAHDVLGSPAALGALGDQATVVHSLGLVAVGVQDILENPTVRKMLKSCLHKTDIAAIDLVRANSTKFSHVFVPSSRRDDLDLLLTLAIDTLLFAPTHPAIFSPVDPKGRIAWQKAMGETLWKWFHNRNILLIMIVCFGEPGYTGPPDFIITDKATPALRGPSDYVLMGRACSACGGKKGNENRNFFPVGHLLDLPSHFSRYLWLRMRRGVNRA